jgi:hypothetical protein
MAVLVDDLNTSFAVRIHKLKMKESVEERVIIMAARHMTVTWPLNVEIWNTLLKSAYIYVGKRLALRLFNLSIRHSKVYSC